MKNKMNQLFKDKLFLVMMVLGLLTIVAAALQGVGANGTLPRRGQDPSLRAIVHGCFVGSGLDRSAG